MKICPRCDSRFDADSWTCDTCGFVPPTIGGFTALAPEHASSETGFDSASFEHLAALESGNFWFRSRNRLILWAIDRYAGRAWNLLEVGCGNGFVLAGIHERFPNLQLTAGEPFVQGLVNARHRVPSATFVQLDGRRVPWERAFGVACAFDVLEHIDDDGAALDGMFRALTPGGTLVVTVPQHRWLWSAADVYAKHERRYRRRELMERLETSGFEVLRLTSFVTTLLPLMFLSRLRNRTLDSNYDPERELRGGGRLATFVLERAMDLDAALIRLGVTLPAGGSLLAVARRPADGS